MVHGTTPDGQGCKGVCVQYKHHGPANLGLYCNGVKRCQQCEIYLKYEGLWCPCCGYRLRTKPRNRRYKTRLRNAQDKPEFEGY